MKLNKILALALSGVMAVSMLAGCSGKTDNGDEGNQPPVVASDAATSMNTYLDSFEFSTSTEQSAYLTEALKNIKYEDVAKADANVPNPLGGGKYCVGVYNTLQNNMRGEAGLKTTFTTAFTPVKGESNSMTYLFMIESKNMTEDAALYQLANKLKSVETKDVVTTSDSKNYNATYTGVISIASVTKTDANGKNAEEAYMILVTLTQNVGSTSVNV